MRKTLSFLWETLKVLIIALVIVVPIRYFLFQPFFVRGQSMEPNFENGDYLIIDELSYRFRSPERGEAIVFKYPQDTTQRYIKRIIGLPGETVEIENGKITIYKENSEPKILNESDYLSLNIQTTGNLKITLGENEYFVLGDNRPVSSDSRRWGTVPKDDIIGRVYLRAWPISALAKIEVPNY
ncbi:MAG: signal peptidase I [Candidatus Pacebacteria bacterium]|nr:signal peptidase I [Candidatus Paceibacterota bacterium]